jgi:hypothetical protein
MPGVMGKSFDQPDETRTPEKTTVAVVRFGKDSAARITLQPGWKWSECIKPVVDTESCQARHVGVVVSGRLRVEHEDGSAGEVGQGDTYLVEPGHDAWVLGDEPFIAYEFESADTYAKS